MAIPTPEQIAKLPKWARQYIHQLEMRAEENKEALAEMGWVFGDRPENCLERLNNDPGGCVYAMRYWPLTESDWIRLCGSFDLRIRGDALEVTLQAGGHRDLIVTPKSSNVIEIRKGSK